MRNVMIAEAIVVMPVQIYRRIVSRRFIRTGVRCRSDRGIKPFSSYNLIRIYGLPELCHVWPEFFHMIAEFAKQVNVDL